MIGLKMCIPGTNPDCILISKHTDTIIEVPGVFDKLGYIGHVK